MKTKTMTTLHLRKSIGRSPLRLGLPRVQPIWIIRGVLLIAVAWFALSPTARAVTPAPDGGYANGNTAEGTDALLSLTTGMFNTANGEFALENNTTGDDNTATGAGALGSNTTGLFNTANGGAALGSNTTGRQNTANGFTALESNTGGIFNTASGAAALQFNTSGNNNTATGVSALQSNTTGLNNTANGVNALFGNTAGQGNTATGFNALKSNTTAFNNTATGQGSLQNNTTGGFNTAEGFQSLSQNTTGSLNIALGSNAGANVTTGSNNIDIGNRGVAGDAATIRIGKVGTQTATFVAGVHGVTVASGVGVIVGSNGQLGTVTSSARFKEAIKPMEKASEAILALQPVTFRYKAEFDPDGIPQFGLVAEQVGKVNPDLVVRDQDGKVNSVRYEAVNAMLLNEFLKEHRNVAQQQSTIAELKTTVAQQQKQIAAQHTTAAQQQKQIEALTITVRKVSERVELTAPAPQLAANND
jgi:Chaperone of endosialidase